MSSLNHEEVLNMPTMQIARDVLNLLDDEVMSLDNAALIARAREFAQQGELEMGSVEVMTYVTWHIATHQPTPDDLAQLAQLAVELAEALDY